jgi:outer membrane murein-binding lipoprotein Lpp
MTKAIALALLLLAGCDKPMTADRADDVLTPLEDRAKVQALQERVRDLERQVAVLQDQEHQDIITLRDITAADAKDTREVNAELSRLADVDDAFRKNIDYLGTFHGIPPQRVKN